MSNKSIALFQEHLARKLNATCLCGEQLVFEPGILVTACHCRACEEKSLEDGAVIYVRGHGLTAERAFADWKRQQENF